MPHAVCTTLPMRSHPHAFQAIKHELSNWHLWTGRGVVIAFAAIAGLTVVAFTWITEHAIAAFFSIENQAATGGALCYGRRCAPRLLFGLHVNLPRCGRLRHSSGDGRTGARGFGQNPKSSLCRWKLSLAKIFLAAWGLLAGLSLGREKVRPCKLLQV